jgi:hypothetical protein
MKFISVVKVNLAINKPNHLYLTYHDPTFVKIMMNAIRCYLVHQSVVALLYDF